MTPLVINRLHRLPADQFYQDKYPKKQIYIHHTVGGSAESSFRHWLSKPEKVGTAFLIDRDGTVFEVFDPSYWAHHLGLPHPTIPKKAHPRNTELNQRSIGIELASEGALVRSTDGKLFAFDGRQVFRDGYVKNAVPWRGYQFFDNYENEQLRSLYALVGNLCERFSVLKRCIEQNSSTTFDERFFDFNGILGHCNVRADKTDPHPLFRFDHLQAFLNGADLGQEVPLP